MSNTSHSSNRRRLALAVLVASVCAAGCGRGLLSQADDQRADANGGVSGNSGESSDTGTGLGGMTNTGAGGWVGTDPGETTSPGVDGSVATPHPVIAVDESRKASLFVPDDLANSVYRFSMEPGSDPVLDGTMAVPSATSVALRGTGELFVASASPPAIYKVTSPFGTPAVVGPLVIGSITTLTRWDVRAMTFVDDELGMVSPGMSGIFFARFNAQGDLSIAWGGGNTASCAGVLWDPDTQILYISQLFPSGGVIQASHLYRTIPLQPVPPVEISGNSMKGPDGMALTTWGELLVANYYGHSISRFLLDGQGMATANGTITGNGLSNPTSLALTPWGELFVGNQGTGTLSRFTFDSSRAAVAHGTFSTPCKPSPAGTSSHGSRLNWISIFPVPSDGTDGGTD